MSTEGPRWTLDTARAMLPEVRKRTAVAVPGVERGLRERADAAGDVRAEIDARLRQEIGRWTREMEALGVAVKGLWLVDFDTGGGYLCWKWPEENLSWFHGYEDGFSGRTRIQ